MLRSRWNALDASGKPQPHPVDDALLTLYRRALCGNGATFDADGRRALVG